MKIKFIFWVLLMACFSCETNKTVSDAEKEKIAGEVKEVVNIFFKGCEDANADMVVEPLLDSPDFVYILNGRALNYKELVGGMKPNFSKFFNQKITIIDEKYGFPDESTVLYTTNCTSLTKYRDGHAKLQDPTVILLIFKKISKTWRIIYGVESFIEKSVPGESSKGLNQVELLKQFVGNWKCEMAKDTAGFWDVKPYGTGLEGYYKFVSKGKILMEGKQIWGYNKSAAKVTIGEIMKGVDNAVYSSWFDSKTTCIMKYFGPASNSGNETPEWKMEFKTPGMFLQTTIINNKPVRTDTWIRVK